MPQPGSIPGAWKAHTRGVGGSYLALALHPVWEEPTDVGQRYKSILCLLFAGHRDVPLSSGNENF